MASEILRTQPIDVKVFWVVVHEFGSKFRNNPLNQTQGPAVTTSKFCGCSHLTHKSCYNRYPLHPFLSTTHYPGRVKVARHMRRITAKRQGRSDLCSIESLHQNTRGADNSLARPGRKQTAATKLEIYSTYSPTKLKSLFSPLL
jgi:hypothetical protein